MAACVVGWSGEDCASVPLILKTVCAESLGVVSVWWVGQVRVVPHVPQSL